MDAERITIECEEDGFWLHITAEDRPLICWRITDPESFYDSAKANIGPWLRERDEAERLYQVFNCDPDESGGYDISDPKRPNHHSVMAEIFDSREGK